MKKIIAFFIILLFFAGVSSNKSSGEKVEPLHTNINVDVINTKVQVLDSLLKELKTNTEYHENKTN